MLIELTPAPSLPSLSEPATFNSRALAFFNWLAGTHVTELEGIPAALGIEIDEIDITSSTASVEVAVPTGVTSARIVLHRFQPVTTDQKLNLRVGTGGTGGSFISTASYYGQGCVQSGSGSPTGYEGTGTAFELSDATGAAAFARGTIDLRALNDSAGAMFIGRSGQTANSGGTNSITIREEGGIDTSSTAVNALQFFCSSGNIGLLRATIYWGSAA